MENFTNNTNVNFTDNTNEDIFTDSAIPGGGHGQPKPSGSKKIADTFTFDLQMFDKSSNDVGSWSELKDALSTTNVTSTIKLTSDISINVSDLGSAASCHDAGDGTITVNGNKILDLNGHKITITETTDSGAVSGKYYNAFIVADGATLKFTANNQSASSIQLTTTTTSSDSSYGDIRIINNGSKGNYPCLVGFASGGSSTKTAIFENITVNAQGGSSYSFPIIDDDGNGSNVKVEIKNAAIRADLANAIQFIGVNKLDLDISDTSLGYPQTANKNDLFDWSQDWMKTTGCCACVWVNAQNKQTTVDMTNVKVGSNDGSYAVCVYGSQTTLNMTNCEVNNVGQGGTLGVLGGANATINGGTYTGESYFNMCCYNESSWYSGNSGASGQSSNPTKLTINNATLNNSKDGRGIIVENYGQLTLSNTTMTGSTTSFVAIDANIYGYYGKAPNPATITITDSNINGIVNLEDTQNANNSLTLSGNTTIQGVQITKRGKVTNARSAALAEIVVGDNVSITDGIYGTAVNASIGVNPGSNNYLSSGGDSDTYWIGTNLNPENYSDATSGATTTISAIDGSAFNITASGGKLTAVTNLGGTDTFIIATNPYKADGSSDATIYKMNGTYMLGFKSSTTGITGITGTAETPTPTIAEDIYGSLATEEDAASGGIFFIKTGFTGSGAASDTNSVTVLADGTIDGGNLAMYANAGSSLTIDSATSIDAGSEVFVVSTDPTYVYASIKNEGTASAAQYNLNISSASLGDATYSSASLATLNVNFGETSSFTAVLDGVTWSDGSTSGTDSVVFGISDNKVSSITIVAGTINLGGSSASGGTEGVFSSGVTIANGATLRDTISQFTASGDGDATFAFKYADSMIGTGVLKSGTLKFESTNLSVFSGGIALNTGTTLIYGTQYTSVTSNTSSDTLLTWSYDGDNGKQGFTNFSDGTIFSVVDNGSSVTYLSRSTVGVVRAELDGDSSTLMYKSDGTVANAVAGGSFVSLENLNATDTKSNFYTIDSVTTSSGSSTITVDAATISDSSTSYAGIAFADAANSNVSRVDALLTVTGDKKYTLGAGKDGATGSATFTTATFTGASNISTASITLNNVTVGSMVFSDVASGTTLTVNDVEFEVASADSSLTLTNSGTSTVQLVEGIVRIGTEDTTDLGIQFRVGNTISSNTFKIATSTSEDTAEDGVILVIENGSSDVTVSDVELGESFMFGTDTYTRTASGLMKNLSDTSKVSYYNNAEADTASAYTITNSSNWLNIHAIGTDNSVFVINSAATTAAADTNTVVWYTNSGAADGVIQAKLTVDDTNSVYTLTSEAAIAVSDISIAADVNTLTLTSNISNTSRITTTSGDSDISLTVGDVLYKAASTDSMVIYTSDTSSYIDSGKIVAVKGYTYSGYSDGSKVAVTVGDSVTEKGINVAFSDGKVVSVDIDSIQHGNIAVNQESISVSNSTVTDTYQINYSGTYLVSTHQSGTTSAMTLISSISGESGYVTLEDQDWLGIAKNVYTEGAAKNGITFEKADLDNSSSTKYAYAVVNISDVTNLNAFKFVYASIKYASDETLTEGGYYIDSQTNWSSVGTDAGITISGMDSANNLNLVFNVSTRANIAASDSQILNINGAAFDAVSGTQTFTISDNTATLYDGSVHVESGNAYSTVSITNSSDVSVLAGDGIIVKAAEGVLSDISGLSETSAGDVFQIGSDVYSDTTLGLIKNDGTNNLLNLASSAESVAYSVISDTANWQVVAAVSGTGIINITGTVTSDTTYINAVDSTASATYATLTTDGVLTSETGHTNSNITQVNINGALGSSGLTISSALVTEGSELKITSLDSGNAVRIGFSSTGKADAMSGVGTGETFIYGDKKYVGSKLGLIIVDSATEISSTTSSAQLFSAVTFDSASDASFALADITNADSLTSIAVIQNYILELSSATSNTAVTYVDSISSPTGIVAKLAANNALSAGKDLSSSATWSEIKVISTTATFDSALTLSGSSMTLVASSEVTMTLSSDKKISELSGLVAGDTITYSGTTYTMSGIGLITGASGSEKLVLESSETQTVKLEGISDNTINIKVAGADSDIVIGAVTGGVVSDTRFVDYVTSEASKVYAEYDADNATLGSATGISATGIAVSLKGIAVNFSSDFANADSGTSISTYIGSQGALLQSKFKVTEAASGFTVSQLTDTESLTSVSGATAITLETGTLSIASTQALTYGTGEIHFSDSDNLVTVTANGENKVQVTAFGLAATNAISMTGLASSTVVALISDSNTTMTFQFMDQTATIIGDADSVTFTVDANGYITSLTGLDAGAKVTFEIGGGNSETIITVNSNTVDGKFELSSSDDGTYRKMTFLGTNEGEDANLLIEDPVYFAISADGAKYNYVDLDESNNIDGKFGNTLLAISDSVGKFADNTLTLSEGVIPSETLPTTFYNTSGNAIKVRGGTNAATTYIESLDKGIGIQIRSDSDLRVVTVANIDFSANDANVTTGGLTFSSDMTLTVTDNFTIKGSGAGVTVAFTSTDVTLNSTAVNVTAPSSDFEQTFILGTASGVANINNVEYKASTSASDTINLNGEGGIKLSTKMTDTSNPANLFTVSDTGAGTYVLTNTDNTSDTHEVYNINGSLYAVVADAIVTSGKVSSGSVYLSSSTTGISDVAVNNTTNSEVVVTSGDIVVNVEGDAVNKIGNIEAGEKFTVGAQKYEMTAAGLFKIDDITNAKSAFLPVSRLSADAKENAYVYNFDDDDDGSDWGNLMALASDNITLDLTDTSTLTGDDTTVFDKEYSSAVAVVKVDEGNIILTDDQTVTSINVGTVKLGAEGAYLSLINFDSAVTISTASGTGIYRINNESTMYEASGTALTISATNSSSALVGGIVKLTYDDTDNHPDSVTDSNGTVVRITEFREGTTSDGISVTASNGAVTTVGDLDDGEKFSIVSDTTTTNYEKTAAGLFEMSGTVPTKILVDSSGDNFSYVINHANNKWADVYLMNSENTLSLTDSSTISANAAVLNSDYSVQAATFIYGADGTYTLTLTDEKDQSLNVEKVEVGAYPGTFTFALKDFTSAVDVDIIGSTGSYVINKNGYFQTVGSDVTVRASSTNIATLHDGTVRLTMGGDYSRVTTTSTTGATAESTVRIYGDTAATVNVTASDGNLLSVSAIDTNDIFKIGGTYYTAKGAGLFTSSSSGEVKDTHTVLLDTNFKTSDYEYFLASETSFIHFLKLDADNVTLDLSSTKTSIVSDLAVITANLDALAGSLKYDADTNALTLVDNGNSGSDVTAVKLGTKYTTLNFSGFGTTSSSTESGDVADGDEATTAADVIVSTTGTTETYTIAGQTYIASGTTLTINANDNASSLIDGTVKLTTATSSVTTSDATVVALTNAADDGALGVVVANGAVTKISAIDASETFTITGEIAGSGTYTATAAGLFKGETSSQTFLVNDSENYKDGTYTLEGASFVEILTVDAQNVLDISAKEITASGTAILTKDLSAVVGNITAVDATTGAITISDTAAAENLTAISLSASNTGVTFTGFAATDSITVTTAATSGDQLFTVGAASYTAVANALTIVSQGDASTLQSGTVRLESTKNVTTYGGKLITCTNDTGTAATGDSAVVTGMTVSVAPGETESITVSGLDIGDKFTVSDATATKTYTMTAIGITDEAGNLYDYTGNGAQFPLTGAESTTLIAPISSDLSMPAATASDTVYTVVDNKDNPTVKLATMTYSATDNSFTFSNLTDTSTLTADIASITAASATTIVTGFNVVVNATSATVDSKYTVNGLAYVVSAGTLTIDATASESTLYNGAVKIDSDASTTDIPDFVKTTSQTTVAAASGNFVVKVTNSDGTSETIVVGDLATSEIFTVNSSDTYTMTTDTILHDGTELYTIGTNKEFTLGTSGTIMIQATTDGAVDLTKDIASAALSDTTTYAIVNNGITSVLANVTYTSATADAAATYAFTNTTGVTESDPISAISVGADSAKFTDINFNTQINTAQGSGTFTLGESHYVASDSTLAIDVKADSSSLNAGTIVVSSETIKLTASDLTISAVTGSDSDGVVATVDSTTGATSITGLNVGGVITYSDTTYEMVADGAGAVLKMTKGADVSYYSYASTETSDAANILEALTSNIAYVQINSATVDLASGTALLSSDVTRVIYSTEENYSGRSVVELASGSGVYELTQGANYATTDAAIVNASGISDTFSVNAAFDATVNAAANANITVNGVQYVEAASSTLEISAVAATSDSTLVNGTVALGGTNPVSVKASDGSVASATNVVDVVNVNVTGGAVTTISEIDVSETFVYQAANAESATTYKMATVGLLVTGENIWDGDVIASENGIVAATALTSDTNWTKMIALESGTLNLVGDSDAKRVIVDATADPTKDYGDVTFNASAYSVAMF